MLSLKTCLKGRHTQNLVGGWEELKNWWVPLEVTYCKKEENTSCTANVKLDSLLVIRLLFLRICLIWIVLRCGSFFYYCCCLMLLFFFQRTKKQSVLNCLRKETQLDTWHFCCVRGMKVSSVSVNQIVNGMEPNKFLRNFLRWNFGRKKQVSCARQSFLSKLFSAMYAPLYLSLSCSR